MFKILNDLNVFFEDCSREISVREYARAKNVSPATASTLLKRYQSEGLLSGREERRFLLFKANEKSRSFIDMSRIFWRKQINELIYDMPSEAAIILTGDISVAKNNIDSEVKLVFLSDQIIKIKTGKIEKKLKRKIEIINIEKLSDIKDGELMSDVLNGYIIRGELK